MLIQKLCLKMWNYWNQMECLTFSAWLILQFSNNAFFKYFLSLFRCILEIYEISRREIIISCTFFSDPNAQCSKRSEASYPEMKSINKFPCYINDRVRTHNSLMINWNRWPYVWAFQKCILSLKCCVKLILKHNMSLLTLSCILSNPLSRKQSDMALVEVS